MIILILLLLLSTQLYCEVATAPYLPAGTKAETITMTGHLTTASTITIKGSAFSVGESTFVVTAGNIGIGTTSPSQKLHIEGTGAEVRTLTVNTDAFTSGIAAFRVESPPYNAIGQFETGEEGTKIITNHYLSFVNPAGSIAVMPPDSKNIRFYGNVGIGTTPEARLEVLQTDTAQAYTMRVGTSTTAFHLVVSTTGNVGIGTTNPGARLDVNGDVIIANRAYGMAYRTSLFDLAAVNTWYNIPLNGGNSNLINVSHSTLTNPERVTVNVSGTYLIQYKVHFRRQGSAHHGVARLLKNNVSEITGSFTLSSPNTGDSNEDAPLIGQVITSLLANDFVTIQVGTNVNVTNEIDVYDGATLPDPATRIFASLTIIKIGP